MLGYRHDGVTDEVLEILSNPVRRRLLFSLFEQGQDDSELPLRQVSGLALEEENTQVELYHIRPCLDATDRTVETLTSKF
jgi:hypothetical protein